VQTCSAGTEFRSRATQLLKHSLQNEGCNIVREGETVQFRSITLLSILSLASANFSQAQECILTGSVPTTAPENASPVLASAPFTNQDFLPPPLLGLNVAIPAQPQRAFASPAQDRSAVVVGPSPVFALDDIPTPKVDLSAIPSAVAVPEVRLVRGNEVVALSNTALRNSGVFQRAISNSPDLAREADAVQAYQMRFQAARQQLERERAIQARLNQQIETRKKALPQPNAVNAPIAPDMAAALNREIDALTLQATEQSQRIDALKIVSDSDQAELTKREVEFERKLWNIGLNGAKVGTVTSTARSAVRSASDEPDSYMMIKAIGNSASDNLGYSRTRVYHNGDFGWRTVPSEYLLPLPVQPNDILYEKVAAGETQRDSDGVMAQLTQDDTINPVTQLKAVAQGYYFYDTGLVDQHSANFSEGVALGGHHAHGAGQSFVSSISDRPFADLMKIDLAANTQVLDAGGGNTVQAFAVANNNFNNNGVDLSSVGIRAYNRDSGSPFQGWAVLIGEKQSFFGDVAITPAGLLGDRNLIGTVNRRDNRIDNANDAGIPQIGLTAPLSDFVSLSGAIEDPDHDQKDVQYTSDATITRLNRWPTLTGNVNFHNLDRTSLLQIGTLIRSNGFESNVTGEEFFATGWGLSGIAQFLAGNSSMFYAGVAGGKGVGRYIVGIEDSAVADPATNSIESLNGIGTFAGYEHWFRDPCNKPTGVLNAAYGYSFMEDPGVAFATENQKLHQAWINYTRFIGEQVAVGVEYEYGFREDASGHSGEDHRFLFVLTLRTQPTAKKTQVQNDCFAPPSIDMTASTNDVARAENLQAATSLQTTAATLDGRRITDVVNQTQRGGAAFQQGL
jgi:hypothetical protein